MQHITRMGMGMDGQHDMTAHNTPQTVYLGSGLGRPYLKRQCQHSPPSVHHLHIAA